MKLQQKADERAWAAANRNRVWTKIFIRPTTRLLRFPEAQ